MTHDEAFQQLNMSVDLIPVGASNRPGTRIQPTHITIHNTANAASGADARMHARFVKGPDARARQVSWHFTVDDQRTIKHLPTNEKGFHAKQGNRVSIGIEICEHQGIDQDAALERAALLAAVLMLAHDIPPERVVTHQHWTGKDCPRVVLRASGGFQAFRERATRFLEELETDAGPEAVSGPGARSFGREGRSVAVADPESASAPDAALSPLGAAPGGTGDRVAVLERLLGHLLAENHQLREALGEAHEAD